MQPLKPHELPITKAQTVGHSARKKKILGKKRIDEHSLDFLARRMVEIIEEGLSHKDFSMRMETVSRFAGYVFYKKVNTGQQGKTEPMKLILTLPEKSVVQPIIEASTDDGISAHAERNYANEETMH